MRSSTLAQESSGIASIIPDGEGLMVHLDDGRAVRATPEDVVFHPGFGARNKGITLEGLRKLWLGELNPKEIGSGGRVLMDMARMPAALVGTGLFLLEAGIRQFPQWSRAFAQLTGHKDIKLHREVYEGARLRVEGEAALEMTPVHEMEKAAAAVEKNAGATWGSAHLPGEKPARLSDYPEYYLDEHGNQPSPRPGKNSHHGVMSAWMRSIFPEYKERRGPAILMAEHLHHKTYGVFNEWRAETARKQGGDFKWKGVSEREKKTLSEKMFDAAGVPLELREHFWKWYGRMMRALNSSKNKSQP